MKPVNSQVTAILESDISILVERILVNNANRFLKYHSISGTNNKRVANAIHAVKWPLCFRHQTCKGSYKNYPCGRQQGPLALKRMRLRMNSCMWHASMLSKCSTTIQNILPKRATRKESYQEQASLCVYNYCHCDLEGACLDTNSNLVFLTPHPISGEKVKWLRRVGTSQPWAQDIKHLQSYGHNKSSMKKLGIPLDRQSFVSAVTNAADAHSNTHV